MTNWKTINAHQQLDEVGNIFQYHGGVKPKACQECKTEFKIEIKEEPLTQKVPVYECEDCKFKNAGGDAALQHKIETDHTIKRELTERIVSMQKQLIGTPYIKITDDDVIILCNSCSG